MAFDFLEDLDEYFCEKYANYDHICILNGYEMPKMQTTERREDGTDYSYTLPASTMRLAAQRNRKDLLAQLKERMTDTTFSFTFRPLGLFARIKGFCKTDFQNGAARGSGEIQHDERGGRKASRHRRRDLEPHLQGRLRADEKSPVFPGPHRAHDARGPRGAVRSVRYELVIPSSRTP